MVGHDGHGKVIAYTVDVDRRSVHATPRCPAVVQAMPGALAVVLAVVTTIQH